MSNVSLEPLISEISHEISRDAKGWYFTQRAAARICGMDRKTIADAFEQAQGPLGAFMPAGKLLRSIAAQGVSPAGLQEFQRQWVTGRITDALVSCLITYAATQKKGDRDADVVRLCGLMAAAGLRALLDASFGVEDVNGRVMARLTGIEMRVKYTSDLADRHRNIGAYTAAVTGAITGHSPKAWRDQLLPSQFGEKAGKIRDHADPITLNIIEACEKAAIGMNATVQQAAAFAADVRRSAEKNMGYQGPQLSPAKLTPRVSRDVQAGKKGNLADATTGELIKLPESDS
jgi:hypothetical protein